MPYDIIIVMQFLVCRIFLAVAHFQYIFISTHLHKFSHVLAHETPTCTNSDVWQTLGAKFVSQGMERWKP